MTRNATLAAGAVLLLAGAAAIAILKKSPESTGGDSQADTPAARAKASGFGTGTAADGSANAS